MSQQVIHHLYAALAPWLALSLLMLGRNPHLSRIRIIGSLLLAVFMLRIPIEGWSGFAWVRMLEPNPSFTLTGLLGVALWGRITQKKLFRAQDWNAAWSLGAGLALLLYPMALGLTSIDPYTWGWGPILPSMTALAASLLLLAGNRLGILLLLPLGGVLLHLQESTNFWDALIDPFYGGLSLLIMMVRIVFPITKSLAMNPAKGMVTSGSNHTE
jgi:hypothetical protein